MTNIIKVRFNKDGQPQGREYSYLSPVEVEVGDIVEMETQRGIAKGTVTQINVPTSEIEPFKDRVKSIIGKYVEEEDNPKRGKESFIERVGKNLVELNREESKEFITGEKNLMLTPYELKEKLLQYENGRSYYEICIIEGTILRAQGAFSTKATPEGIAIVIPDWDSFISKVNAFHVACGPY